MAYSHKTSNTARKFHRCKIMYIIRQWSRELFAKDGNWRTVLYMFFAWFFEFFASRPANVCRSYIVNFLNVGKKSEITMENTQLIKLLKDYATYQNNLFCTNRWTWTEHSSCINSFFYLSYQDIVCVIT